MKGRRHAHDSTTAADGVAAGDEHGRIAWPAGRDLGRDGVAGDLADCVDD